VNAGTGIAITMANSLGGTTASGASASTNYTLTQPTVTGTINVLPVVLAGNAIYNGTNNFSLLNTGSSMVVANAVGSDVITVGGQATMAASGVGTQSLVGSLNGLTLTNSNYTLTGGSGTVSVTAAPLGISVTGTYSGSTTIVPTSGGYVITGLVGNDTVTSITAVTVRYANVSSNSNNYITGVLIGGGTASMDNYAISGSRNATLGTSTTNKVTISPAPLTVAVKNAAKFVTQADPSFEVLYTGFVNGETAAAGSANVTLGSIASSITNCNTGCTNAAAGAYTLTASGYAAANYTVTHTSGTYTVLPSQSMLVSISVASQSISYGASPSSSYNLDIKYMDANNSISSLTPTLAAGVYSVSYGGSTASFEIQVASPRYSTST
jgi:hypothetical protein